MASVSPGSLMCLDPDVARTGPEPYAEYARGKKMSLMLGLDTLLLQNLFCKECCTYRVKENYLVQPLAHI